MYANKPEMAKEFESKTPKGKKLPKKMKKGKGCGKCSKKKFCKCMEGGL